VNSIEHSISVINTLDAKLHRKEEAHLCNSSRSEEELGVLRADIQSKVDDYLSQYGVTPAWALPSRADSNNGDSTSVAMESLSSDSSTKKKTKDKRRFFLTDTMRSCTPTSAVTLASSIDSTDCTDCSITLADDPKRLVSIVSEFTAKDTIAEKDPRGKNETSAKFNTTNRRKSTDSLISESFLTDEEENRVERILYSDQLSGVDESNISSVANIDEPYGGELLAKQSAEIDAKLYFTEFSAEFLDITSKRADTKQTQPGKSHPRKNILQDMAMERGEKKREIMIDKALKSLSLKPLLNVRMDATADESNISIAESEYDKKTKKYIASEDIRRIINETRTDLNDKPLAVEGEIKTLLLSIYQQYHMGQFSIDNGALTS